jgi:CubicO group peptidase (beta-lactamase class C family)
MSYCNHNYVLLGEIIRRLTGRPLADLFRERIFEPLGMTDSSNGLPASARLRIVEGVPQPHPLIGVVQSVIPHVDRRQLEEAPGAAGGVFSTAMDLAIFGQTFLNGGTYGGARILSRAAVTAMTRNQIPGIGAQMGPTFHKEASWGYGWGIGSEEKWKYFSASLPPPTGFGHSGFGSAMLWVDPTNEIVVVYLEVTLRVTELIEPLWNADLFYNAVYAAVAD